MCVCGPDGLWLPYGNATPPVRMSSDFVKRPALSHWVYWVTEDGARPFHLAFPDDDDQTFLMDRASEINLLHLVSTYGKTHPLKVAELLRHVHSRRQSAAVTKALNTLYERTAKPDPEEEREYLDSLAERMKVVSDPPTRPAISPASTPGPGTAPAVIIKHNPLYWARKGGRRSRSRSRSWCTRPRTRPRPRRSNRKRCAVHK